MAASSLRVSCFGRRGLLVACTSPVASPKRSASRRTYSKFHSYPSSLGSDYGREHPLVDEHGEEDDDNDRSGDDAEASEERGRVQPDRQRVDHAQC